MCFLSVSDGTYKWNPDSKDVTGVPEEGLAKLREEMKAQDANKAEKDPT